jgi:dienelactone hydrolase
VFRSPSTSMARTLPSRRTGLLFCAVVTAGALGCGPTAPFQPPPASAAASPSLAPPGKKVRFVLAIDGRPAGSEVWNVSAAPDGSQAIAFETTVETPRGLMKGSGHYAILPSHLPDEAEITVTPPSAPATTFRLTRAGADLTMSLQGGGREDELKAGKPSNLFEPRPFFVGLAPVCALLSVENPPPLVEFPGSAISVIAKKTLAGTSVFSLDHGGLGRTLLACDGVELVAVLDPWTGLSAVREGSEPVREALAKSLERTKPATPPDLVEEEVSVVSDDATLACSFLKPAPAVPTSAPSKTLSKARLPAVVFATGSGPEDRDEDTLGRGGLKLSLFKVMAIALAEKGIASLRCDDRGTAKSTGSFENATLPTFVRDARQTLLALAKRPEVDPSRLGFIGHSEGAVIGPLVAAQGGKLRAMMLMSAPGRPLPEIGMIQEETFLRQSGLPADQIQKQLDAQRDVMAAIRAGKPLPEEIRAPQKDVIEKQRAWLKSHFDNDVQAELAHVPKMSIFVAHGGKDSQIPSEDTALVKKGLAAGKNPDPKVKLYPDLNHLFAVSRDGGVTEYADADARIDEGFLADTVDFFTHALTL